MPERDAFHRLGDGGYINDEVVPFPFRYAVG